MMPQNDAGPRTEPPVSLPRASSQRPAAMAAADPDDEPPGTRPGAAGLTGVPSRELRPSSEKAISAVCVLPTKRAPAARSFSTTAALALAGPLSARFTGLPQPVG